MVTRQHESATYKSQVQCPTDSATTPPVVMLSKYRYPIFYKLDI